MIINNKRHSDWKIEDIKVILDNEDYKENDTIDYKINFAFLETNDKEQQNKKKDEFRNDICAFANSNGGYLVFGVSEDKGIPKRDIGVKILNNNTDAFELNLRNIIGVILPSPPPFDIKFIKQIEDKYIVIIRILKGSYAPYISKTGDAYKFNIRRGNGKVAMNYNEVKTMFNQSLQLSGQIQDFRKSRIQMCREREGIASGMNGQSFALVQIIPNFSFMGSFALNPFEEFWSGKIKFREIFRQNGDGSAIPNVDGIAFCEKEYGDKKYLQIFKSGIVEKYIDIEIKQRFEGSSKKTIFIDKICHHIKSMFNETMRFYNEINVRGPIYICISLIGCKDCRTEVDLDSEYIGYVDRQEVLCIPIEIFSIDDEDVLNKGLETAILDFQRAIGIRNYRQ